MIHMKRTLPILFLISFAATCLGQLPPYVRSPFTTNSPATISNIVSSIAVANGIQQLNGSGTNTTLTTPTLKGTVEFQSSGITITPYADGGETGLAIVGEGGSTNALIPYNDGASIRFPNGILFSETPTDTVPKIKTTGTSVKVRLGDDSADAPITASDGTFSGALTTTGITNHHSGDLGVAGTIYTGDVSGTNAIFDNIYGNFSAVTNAAGKTPLFNETAGNGAELTNLNASALSTGTVPLARLPGLVLTNESSVESAYSIGKNSGATASGAVTYGEESQATGVDSVAIGKQTYATEWDAAALGAGSVAGHESSTAVGALSQTTEANQIRLGTASHTVSVPGKLIVSGGGTNTLGATVFTNGVYFYTSEDESLNADFTGIEPNFPNGLNAGGNIHTTGAFTGNAVNLTNIPAAQLTGTLPTNTFPAVIPATTVNGVLTVGSNLTVTPGATPNLVASFGSANTLVLTNGNVGIGTTSPAGNLDIYTSGAPAYGQLVLGRDGYNYIQAGGAGGSSGALAFIAGGLAASDANSSLVLKGSGVSYFNKGNVGIGTTNPTNKLQVIGNVESSGTVYANAALFTNTATFPGALYVNNLYYTNLTDYSDAPDTLADAIAIIESHESKNGKVDHSKLSPLAWGNRTFQRETGTFSTNTVAAVWSEEKLDESGKVIEAARELEPSKEVVTPIMESVTEPDPASRNVSKTISGLCLVVANQQKQIQELQTLTSNLLVRMVVLEKAR